MLAKLFLTIAAEQICAVPFGLMALGGLAWARQDWRQRPENRRLIIVSTILMAFIYIGLQVDCFYRIYSD